MKKTATITHLLGISQQYMAMLLKVICSQWSMYELGKRDLPPRSQAPFSRNDRFFIPYNFIEKNNWMRSTLLVYFFVLINHYI